MLKIERCLENPIVRPGKYPWRAIATLNPAVLLDDNGKFYMYERTAGGLSPFHCYIGMLQSEDGVHFHHVVDYPVVTPEMLGSKYGSVQDPRIVKIDGRYLMTVAYRQFAWHSKPTGLGVPDSWQGEYPGFDGDEKKNQTRSAVLESTDRIKWEFVGWVNPPEIDDRNVILFPEKIDGRYAALRRPTGFVSTNTAHGTEHPHVMISFSDDLKTWTEPESLLKPKFPWEDNRLGGSTPPIRTDEGWLLLYHGVENQDSKVRKVCYRLGAAMLDLENPRKVIARCKSFIMEPEEYYEKTGLYIPNVIFPTAAINVNGDLHIYYGCCDTAIGLATVPMDKLIRHVLSDGNQ